MGQRQTSFEHLRTDGIEGFQPARPEVLPEMMSVSAGPGCYDAVAIARAAGFRMLVMSRIRDTLGAGQKERPRHPEKSLPDNNS